MRFKSFLRNLNVLNLLLATAIGIFAIRILLPMNQVQIKYATPPAPTATAEPQEAATEKKPVSILEYAIIAEQNLFHPDRIIPPEKKDEKPLPKPEFVLYGTIVTDTTRIAFLEDKKPGDKKSAAAPGTAQASSASQGRGKKQRILKKGDTLSGFTLKEIEPEKVVMARGEEIISVYLNDPAQPKTREVVASVQPTTPQTGSPVPPPSDQVVAQPSKPGQAGRANVKSKLESAARKVAPNAFRQRTPAPASQQP